MFRCWKTRRRKRDEERLKRLCEMRLREIASRPSYLSEPMSATGTFQVIGALMEQATDEKKKARSTLQKLLDMLPSKKDIED
jgi:hypothetical protein